jgi:hypothetical protein
MSPDGKLEEEYKDISNNLRFYGNLRFAQLTLFFAITVGLLTVIFKLEPKLEPQPKLFLELIGLTITFVFWRMEESSTRMWRHYVDCAQILEKQLDFRQYSSRYPDNPINNPKKVWFDRYFKTYIKINIVDIFKKITANLIKPNKKTISLKMLFIIAIKKAWNYTIKIVRERHSLHYVKTHFFNATNSVRLLFLIFSFFWIITAILKL